MNMDSILKAVLISDKPEAMKSALVKKIKDSASQPQTSQAILSMFEATASYILEQKSDFIVSNCKDVYLCWAKYNLDSLQEYWTVNYVQCLFDGKFHNGTEVIWLLHQSFKLLQSSKNFDALCTVVETKAVSFLRDNPGVDMIVPFIHFLSDFKQCIPKADNTATFCIAIIHASTTFQAPETKDLSAYVKNVTYVGKFLAQIWQKGDRDCVMKCLQAIFKVISIVHENALQPAHALGAIASNIPTEYIPYVIKTMVTDTSIPDIQITAALTRMIDWLSWPLARNIDHWVIALLNGLASVKKYTILIGITEAKIDQVYEKTGFPVVRDSAMNVLSHMLLSYQCSSGPFHKICMKVPATVEQLRRENTEGSLKSLHQLAELMHCLIALHPGFPELYDPILDAVKGIDPPSDLAIKAKLDRSKWTAQNIDVTSYVSQFAKKSETGLTGLVNLGNTCYMNSIIQALFMSDNFRQDVLTSSASLEQSALFKLQYVFAFLMNTQRAAYAPHMFLKACRPPWFTAGLQQDCSEFLKYLLDLLHEQERSKLLKKASKQEEEQASVAASLPHTLIQRHFGGLMQTTYTCLKCGKESRHKEMFTDLPLPFPENSGSKNGAKKGGAKSLAGGDDKSSQSDKESEKNNSSVQECNVMLDDLLANYLKVERLEGDNKYECERCKSLQCADRSMRIVQSPDCLILTLLRFYYDGKTHNRGKIFTDVKYPKVIHLPVYAENSSVKSGNHTVKKSRTGPSNSRVKQTNGSDCRYETYCLCAVVIHSGTTSECGHYYTYARNTSPVLHDSHHGSRDSHHGSHDSHHVPHTANDSYPVSHRSHDSHHVPQKSYDSHHVPVPHSFHGSGGSHHGSPGSSGLYHGSHHGSPGSSGLYHGSHHGSPGSSGLYHGSHHGAHDSQHRSSGSHHGSHHLNHGSQHGHHNHGSHHSSHGSHEGQSQAGDFLSNTWYLCNDSRVTFASYDSFSNVTKRFSKDTAYVLFYKRIPPAAEASASHSLPTRHNIILKDHLRKAIDEDNKLYLQEQELESRSKAVRSGNTVSGSSYNWRDDDNQGPPGSCGGGGGLGGLDTSGSRFVF